MERGILCMMAAFLRRGLGNFCDGAGAYIDLFIHWEKHGGSNTA